MQTTQLTTTDPLKQFCDLFEGRFPTDEELDELPKAIPQMSAKASVIRILRDKSDVIASEVVTTLFARYPFEKKHIAAPDKTKRDFKTVIAYCVNAYVREDVQWLKDKLLYWLRTIIQSFDFPDLSPGARRIFPDLAKHTETLRPNQRSIYEAYTLINKLVQKAIPAADAKEIAPYFVETITILSTDQI